ncbi:MAG: hypothetical protein K0R58_35 [Ramlibacter sp.]|jgi:hypothetical protein|nr:hypothetical protein [Ramlibacter sp.]
MEELRERIARVWLLGTLVNCSPKNYFSAFYELFHGLIFATMPFWLGALILTVVSTSTSTVAAVPGQEQNHFLAYWLPTFWNNAVSTFSRGELLVFSISLLSPTLWLATHEPDGAQHLPHRRPISTIAVVIIVIGAVLFGVLKSGVSVLTNAVFWVSVSLTILAVLLRYLVLVYHGYRLPARTEKELLRPTEQWMETVDLHRRGMA